MILDELAAALSAVPASVMFGVVLGGAIASGMFLYGGER